jgi:uncharacterized membrane protein
VTGDSGHSRKSVTFERNERSRSAGTAGHVQAESAVRLARNTQLAISGLAVDVVFIYFGLGMLLVLAIGVWLLVDLVVTLGNRS